MKRNKIILFGNFGTKNWGNEGTLEATMQNVRKNRGDRQIVCICTDPDDARKRYGIDTLSARVPYTRYFMNTNSILIKALRKLLLAPPVSVIHLFKGIGIMISSTTMIVPGTGILSNFGTGSFGIPYLVFKWCLLAKICGVKLVFLGNGAGPLREKLSRKFIACALKLADYRSYRSEADKSFIKNIGVNTENDHVHPDLAFDLTNRIFDQNETDGANQVIGLGLMDYYGKYGISKGNESVYQNYINTMYEFVEWCISKQYKVRILIGDSTYDTSVKQEFLQLLRDNLDERFPEYIIDGDVKTLNDLLLQISSTEIIISPRFHNIIFGLMLSKPVLSLSYHNKVESLMENFGILDYSLSLDELDINVLIDKFKMLDLDKNKITEKTEIVKKDYREEIANLFKDLFAEGVIS